MIWLVSSSRREGSPHLILSSSACGIRGRRRPPCSAMRARHQHPHPAGQARHFLPGAARRGHTSLIAAVLRAWPRKLPLDLVLLHVRDLEVAGVLLAGPCKLASPSNSAPCPTKQHSSTTWSPPTAVEGTLHPGQVRSGQGGPVFVWTFEYCYFLMHVNLYCYLSVSIYAICIASTSRTEYYSTATRVKLMCLPWYEICG
jgi:hypothetical protein